MDTLFVLAKALGADDVVSPTIPFTPPIGVITPTPVTTGPSISLECSVVTVKKGDRTKIRVLIYTDGQEVKEFSFKISYNKAFFKIIDGDANAAGIQIPYSNTFFAVQTNTVDESNGVINFKATATSGTAPITNRVIAEFEVEGTAIGIGAFTIDKKSSTLISSNNIDILNTVNSVNINVSSSISVTITSTPKPTVKPTLLGGGTITPRTALGDDAGSIGSIFLGAILIIAGFYFFKKKRDYDIHR